MAEEKEQKTVKVTLNAAMSEADIGHAAQTGDVVEVDAETAARWIAAGVAEPAGPLARRAAEEPAEKPPAVPRRAGSS